MSITFRCPCGESLVAEPEHAGMQVQCPTCDEILTVPKATAAPPPPPKKKARVVDDEDDEDRPRKKKRKRNYGDDDEPEHVRKLMAKANAELDEEEDRQRRQGGGLHVSPGIVQGGISMLCGVVLLVAMCFVPCGFYGLILAGVLIVGGLVRVVLGFTGQGTD